MVNPRGAGQRNSLTHRDVPLVRHELLSRVAARVHVLRFGEGLEGLALGQGFRLVLAQGLTPGHVTYDEGLVIVAHDPDPVALRAQILRVIARVALRNEQLPTNERNVAHLAVCLGRTGSLVARCGMKKHRGKRD